MDALRSLRRLALPLLLRVLLLQLGSHVTRGEGETEAAPEVHVYASSAHLRLLAEREVTLLGAVERYVRAERTRLDSIERWAKKVPL